MRSLISSDVIQEMCEKLRTTPEEGCVVEVGVYQGGSLQHLVSAAGGRTVFAYDTFTGIPFKGALDVHDAGDFADTSAEEVIARFPTVTFGVGVFPESVLPMPPCSFVHVDCDQYESIWACIEHFSPRMLRGGIMWFDDYAHLPGATLAVARGFPRGIRLSECGGKGYAVF